jgi:hypothetical protein
MGTVKTLSINSRMYQLIVEQNGPDGLWTAEICADGLQRIRIPTFFVASDAAKEVAHQRAHRHAGVGHVCVPSCTEGWADYSLERR